MNFLLKIQIPISNFGTCINQIFYYVGLTIANILKPFTLFINDLDNKIIESNLELAQILKFDILKSFFVGIANYYIFEKFYHLNHNSSNISRKDYVECFNKELYSMKSNDYNNEIVKSVNNYYNIDSIFNSILNLEKIYINLNDIKCETSRHVLYDYLFMETLANKIFRSLI